ncbi:MAG: SRPBCC family protein [Planctomycetota bacterium]|nr:SRPBCC family protein [Planctomycetota bacterium]
MSELARVQYVPVPIEEVFRFFGEPRNLEAITPPWLHFQIRSLSEGELGEGSLIGYALRLHGVPVRWRTRISCWQPPYRFVDEQVRGPYRSWIHTHTFEEIEGGTRIQDHVAYRAPGGRLVERLFVRRDLERIFDYRAEAIAMRFGVGDALSCV